MKKITFIISILLVHCTLFYAQVNQEWVAIFEGPNMSYDRSSSIAADAMGNVYVTGTFDGYISGSNILTLKYNSQGVLLWEKHYDGPASAGEGSAQVITDNLGNVYITGTSEGLGTNLDMLTIKYNSSGVEQWIARYNSSGTNSDVANFIALDANGYVYIAGQSVSNSRNFAVVKYNPSGVQQWVRNYTVPGNAFGTLRGFKLDPSGNAIITGFVFDPVSIVDIVTIKYSSTGDQQWITRYNGPANGEDSPALMEIDSFGNLYITGHSFNGESYDYLTLKYDQSGQEVWVKRYSGLGYANFTSSIDVDLSGNVIVTGESFDSLNNCNDCATVKYNNAGVQQWVVRNNDAAHRSKGGNTIVTDSFGNIYVNGYLEYQNNNDVFTVKYDSNGSQLWYINYDNNLGNDAAIGMVLDPANNVYLTSCNTDISTIKYSQTVGIIPLSTEFPSGYRLSQNYPNPFNPSTNIIFDLPKSAKCKLTVFDMLGKEISVLVNQFLPVGSYKADWDAGNYPNGVYFYKLEAGSFAETKKMILIK